MYLRQSTRAEADMKRGTRTTFRTVEADMKTTTFRAVETDFKKTTFRTARPALGLITNKQGLVNDGAPTKPRLTKVAARRLIKLPALTAESEEAEEEEEDMVVDTPSYQVILIDRVELHKPVLPHGVADIDEDDIQNPQLCAEYASVMYVYLRELEGRLTVRPDYLEGCPTTGKMRTVLVDWLVDVQQQFKLLQETLYLTVAILDRFLCIEGSSIHRSRLQLVGITAMFIAAKIEEIYAPELNDFVYIADNAYDHAEVRAMELRIIKALDYRLCSPLSINFLRRFSKAGDVDVTQHALAKYILETLLLDYSAVSLPASLCAASSLYLSLRILETEGAGLMSEGAGLWTPALVHYTGYSREQVETEAARPLESLKRAHTGKFTAVKVKYSSKLMQRIALEPQINIKLGQL